MEDFGPRSDLACTSPLYTAVIFVVDETILIGDGGIFHRQSRHHAPSEMWKHSFRGEGKTHNLWFWSRPLYHAATAAVELL